MAGAKGRSGGARAGAGRPRKSAEHVWLTGNAGKRAERAAKKPEMTASVQQAAAEAAQEAVHEPRSLSKDERAVWRDLAPHALSEGTLTPRTVASFVLLCRLAVMERKMAEAPMVVGTKEHRSMIQRFESLLLRFRLMPDGRPAPAKPSRDEPSDPFAQFDGPKLVKGA